MEIKETKEIAVDQLKSLYNDVGSTAYTQQEAVMEKIIPNSFDVLSIWEEEELVGLIRCISDGAYILYIQDILVKEAYQGQGIGSALLQKIIERHSSIRQKVLMTDYTKKTIGFYEKNGFHRADNEKWGISLVRIDS